MMAERIVHFTQALRGAGLAVGLDQTETCLRALTLVDVTVPADFYHAARSTLVTRREDLPVFDDLFTQHFGRPAARQTAAQKTPQAPRHDPNKFQRTALASFVAERARAADVEIEVADRTHTASSAELLQKKEFSRLSDAELQALKSALRAIRWEITERRTRRRTPTARGPELDLRRTVRAGARRGGKVVSLLRRTRKLKQRPLVLLADISGSMELYSRLLLQFFHGLSQSRRGTETFVFGTRLTRITADLKLRDVDRALARASAEIMDYAGGTRIGECLAKFNRSWGRRVLRRGAVVVIVSDGCDTGDVAVLSRELRRLSGLVHRLIWLNPRLGAPGYQPLAAGMAAALEHLDDFLPIHNLQSLHALATHLSRLPARRTGLAAARRPTQTSGGLL